MNILVILYTYTVRYLCHYVYKGRRQAVHLINEKECMSKSISLFYKIFLVAVYLIYFTSFC